MDTMTQWVRSIEMELYLRAEVATALGVPQETVRQLAASEPQLLGPSWSGHFGGDGGPGRDIALYTPADVARLEAYFARLRSLGIESGRRGRRKIWTDAERKARQRRGLQVTYWRRRAETLTARGSFAKAADAIAKADELDKLLADEATARHDQLDAARDARR